MRYCNTCRGYYCSCSTTYTASSTAVTPIRVGICNDCAEKTAQITALESRCERYRSALDKFTDQRFYIKREWTDARGVECGEFFTVNELIATARAAISDTQDKGEK